MHYFGLTKVLSRFTKIMCVLFSTGRTISMGECRVIYRFADHFIPQAMNSIHMQP